MTPRERIGTILGFGVPDDRIGITDSYWPETLDRWHKEGLPDGVSPLDYFETDFDYIYLDASLRMEEAILEETDEYTIRKDKHGFTAKVWKHQSGALGYLDHVVKTREDWDRLRHRLDVDFGGTSRIGTQSYFDPFVRYPSWEEMAAKYRDLERRGKFIALVAYAPFEATWRKHGFERTLTNLVEDPGLVADMFEAHATLVIDAIHRGLSVGIRPDGLCMSGDIGHRKGLLFSPATYRSLLFPAHRRICEFCRSNGVATILHTDGDIRSVFGLLIDAGFHAIEPLEASAGLDVCELKKQYNGKVAFMGNISAPGMSNRQGIAREIKTKVPAAKQGGGYIYHSDHSVPPTVSFDDYRHVMELLDRYGRYDE